MKFIKFWWLLAAVLSLAGCQNASKPAPEVLPKLGLQAYTFRSFTFAETLEKAERLGIPYLQAYNGQALGGGIAGKFGHDMDAATQAQVLAWLTAHHVTLASYGVVNTPKIEEWNKILTFAKAMGIQEVVTSAPSPLLAQIVPLAKAQGIAISLHNHPEPSIYFNPQAALDAVQPFGPEVGLCADTGHWVRSGFDPVASLKLAEGRILSLHFKDLNEVKVKGARDVPWGTGVSNAAGQIAELRRQHFHGIVYIEYEHNTKTLEQDVAQCVAFFKQAIALPLEDLVKNKVVPVGYSANAEALWADARGQNSKRWPEPKPLFSADLSNAELKPGSWVWENGVLVAKGGGEIWTKDSYKNFSLSLEFSCEENSNSGVLLRASDTAEWLNNAIEVQILQGDNPDSKHVVGAIFDVLGPRRQIHIKPGEWYRYVIIAKDNNIRVSLNGEELVNINLDEWVEAGKNPDGTPNKFTKAYKDMAREGRIGLQYHDTPISYRNLLIERL